MACRIIQCGEYANQSERIAAQRTKLVLEALRDAGKWVILTNLSSSSSPVHQSDELDQVCVGPRGVFVIEIKHWDTKWMRDHSQAVVDEAEKLTHKAKRLGGRVRSLLANAPRAKQTLMLTRETGNTKVAPVCGVPIFTLSTLGENFSGDSPKALNDVQIDLVVQGLEPRSRIQLDGKVRRIGAYQHLELRSPTEDRFHRIYRGVHQRTKEKVVLHLYDLSASDEKEPFRLAEREFRTLQLLQKSRWVPRFRDSLQDLPTYPGELIYFSLLDSDAPTVAVRGQDAAWTEEERCAFALQSFDALKELHGLTDESDTAVLHRNILPQTLLVAARNKPIFTDFSVARIPTTQTLGVQKTYSGQDWAAPEVASGGLSAATQTSDVYSLCQVLIGLFPEPLSLKTSQVVEVLRQGTAEKASARPDSSQICEALKAILTPSTSTSIVHQRDALAAEFWCEGHMTLFREKTLRVVCKLGRGGVGATFKVEQVDPDSGENFGTYVAKVIHSSEAGAAALRAYQRVRSHTTSAGLSVVFETAHEWQADRVVALLKWVDGNSLDTLTGVLPLVAEECGDTDVESLVRRWLIEGCSALAILHAQGLVHGDVSPRNIICDRGGLTLTDYDLVTPIGQPAWGIGAEAYCSPEVRARQSLQPSDDFFALAGTMFSVIFDRSPFVQPTGVFDKTNRIKWREGERESLGSLVDFFDRATNPDRTRRLTDIREALSCLKVRTIEVVTVDPSIEDDTSSAPPPRVEQVVPWLDQLLSVYPGSPHGNAETRGLDSEFAVATYVETPLEEELRGAINCHEARLVILCGNAGDGKTALLQHLASGFGVPRQHSAERVWEATFDGLTLRANLDGSAAWKNQSANDLLDEFLCPFLNGPPEKEIVHLIAINDGRLLEWLETQLKAGTESTLTDTLRDLLASDGESTETPTWLRFITLNHRSLVGGRTGQGSTISTDFFDRLITQLLGDGNAASIWSPCHSCSAWDRCTAGPNAHRLLSNSDSPEGVLGDRLRTRLRDALQAVHQRGEVHITARELRAALSYVLFGVRSCLELHSDPGHRADFFWDMAFAPETPFRQGELLRELSRLDPALEAHPHLDRWLTGRSARDLPGSGPAYSGLHLDSARRRAYFEWQPEQIDAVAGDPFALGLAGGQHLRLFRESALRDFQGNDPVCKEICLGISQLENLPTAALRDQNSVPLKITPRTPTETVFWVEKPLDHFRLEAEWPRLPGVHLPVLPRRLRLVYRFADGREEALPMAYGLFHTLLGLASGEQLSELRSDDLFANLEIFTQRLVQEDEANLRVWNPKADETVYQLGIQRIADRQIIECKPVAS